MKKEIFNHKTLSLLILLNASFVNAACIQNPNLRNIVVNVPNHVFNIQYDDLGTRELATTRVNFKNAPVNTFSGNNGQCGRSYLHGDYINGWVPNSNKIAATNIPGIGVRIKATQIGDLNVRYGPAIAGRLSWELPNPYWTITFIKTGQVTASNSLKAGIVSRLTQQNPAPHNSTWNISSLNIPSNAVRVNVLKCTTQSTNYTVNLGSWYDTQFPSIGSFSNSYNIPITLNCAAGTNIKTTVTSSAGYVDTATGKIKLSGTGSATGIAIQLLDRNNTPIKLNTKNSLQNNVPGGNYSFNWKARYIKTASKITPGTANSTATINIRYE
ncbi:fimbrial protein [Providencia rettgeri]|uniref:fimbrial protein n=1 Tax=Providencia rettgeri TaxID=587 RepID=UPI0034E0A6EB